MLLAGHKPFILLNTKLLLWLDTRWHCGQVIRVLDFGAEGHRFKSHLGQDWKTLTVHQTENGYLTIVGEGLRRQKERIGHHLSYPIAQDIIGL